ncbi:hypothetical protein T4E_1149 [Trichinella pseudospiralis]|uniref:Uncharacterized protein n=1 Tax=Trichinella pseudospiralis TaxID=6337 RepID=A0A0V1FF47_TRIPS|nr:hypothetical protein T4E_1149 [Trichinella pseudospiralis]KRY84574.1 hypothetical protein T4D_9946 [Trichinella pseudospiralis]
MGSFYMKLEFDSGAPRDSFNFSPTLMGRSRRLRVCSSTKQGTLQAANRLLARKCSRRSLCDKHGVINRETKANMGHVKSAEQLCLNRFFSFAAFSRGVFVVVVVCRAAASSLNLFHYAYTT